jgi:hypothetical protein
METTLERMDMSQYSAPAATTISLPEDDLAFFAALWFWIPAGLGLWAAIIWAIFRVV